LLNKHPNKKEANGSRLGQKPLGRLIEKWLTKFNVMKANLPLITASL